MFMKFLLNRNAGPAHPLLDVRANRVNHVLGEDEGLLGVI